MVFMLFVISADDQLHTIYNSTNTIIMIRKIKGFAAYSNVKSCLIARDLKEKKG